MHLPGLNETMQQLMSGRLKQGQDLAGLMAEVGSQGDRGANAANSAQG
jgi:hypothetical protein